MVAGDRPLVEKGMGLYQIIFRRLELSLPSRLRLTEWVVKPFSAPNVVLSVGRILDPALAVQYLNPELPPPHTKSGVFFACRLLLADFFFAFVRQLHPVCEHGVSLFQTHTFRGREHLDGDGVAPTLANLRLHFKQLAFGSAER